MPLNLLAVIVNVAEWQSKKLHREMTRLLMIKIIKSRLSMMAAFLCKDLFRTALILNCVTRANEVKNFIKFIKWIFLIARVRLSDLVNSGNKLI